MLNYELKLKEIIQSSTNEGEIIFQYPADSKLGDISLPCFSLAKALKKSPQLIAEGLKEAIEVEKLYFIEDIRITGGYLNIFYNKAIFIQEVLEEVLEAGEYYGSSKAGKGKNALIEHTSINPNASPHVGRARNALIGDVIVRLLKFQGYNVETHYFVNDIGKQIAMLVMGGRGKDNISFKDLLNIYIDINKRVEENPSLEEEAFELLNKLENGDSNVRDEFKNVVNICIDGQTNLFNKLGINYDVFQYESDYIFNHRTKEILEALQQTGKLLEDQHGRLYLDLTGFNLPMETPVLVLTRKDKTSLYPLRDIAYTIDKIIAAPERNIIVLGEDQKLYFQQICAALKLLGYNVPQGIHYSFVLLAEGKMSTRKGTVVLLEDFMEEAVAKASQYISRNNQVEDKTIAERIAFGAVKYAILKVDNNKNVTFDWDTALSFEGDSGPYLQYSCARINSIIKKHNKSLPNQADYSRFVTDIEYDIVKEIARLETVAEKALQEYSPNILANYTYNLTKKFSSFYHQCPILNCGDEELKSARLVLLQGILQVLKTCLNLLGIEAVEYM